MSSDLYIFGGSFYPHSSPDMASSDTADLFFFPDTAFSPPRDSPVESILEAISNNTQNQQNPVDESHLLDQFASTVISSSPPNHHLENLCLYQSAQLQSLSNDSNLENGYGDFRGLGCLEVKMEECQVGFDRAYSQTFAPHSYSGVENVAKYFQRSYSSNCFEGEPSFPFQPRFDSLAESPNFHPQALSSPENNFFSGQMRRACSTGDLQNMRKGHTTQKSYSSPLASESSLMEETNFKVGRYTAEERKERISKYKAKRNQRNFNKTIKYACRKTLADNRPRIRGRFARNDETGEIPKAACSARDEDEDELWPDGLHEEEDGAMAGGTFASAFCQPQFHFYGCY